MDLDLQQLFENAGISLPNENSLGEKIIPDDDPVKLQNFWNWFSDSKAIKNGKPMIFYHGTPNDFSVFDIKKSSPEFKLITFIQDETHNFAINYHRKLRDKNITKSVLDSVPGLGEVRKRLLLEKFGSVENIKNSTVEELVKIKGINKKIAQDILDLLNKED